MVSDASIRSLVRAMAADLAAVPGVLGVTLGGSHARGTSTPASDVDLGIYHAAHPGATLAQDLTDLARHWSTTPAAVGEPGSWGPWVDAGAWLTVDLDGASVPVDWIFRDLDRASQQVGRALRGEYAFHDQPGHPLGFLDVAYAGELATAVVLADPSGRLAALRARLDPYPPALADAFRRSAWEVGFLLDAAAKATGRADVAYVSHCLGKAVMLAAHATLATHGVWVTNEKGLVPEAARHDPRLAAAASELAHLGSTPEELDATIGRLRTQLGAP